MGTERHGHSPTAAPSSTKVVVVGGPDSGLQVRAQGAEGRITVGTAADVDLRVTDKTVSQYHLEIRTHARGFQVIDLSSTNGTRYGQAFINEGFVPAGARLALGATVIEIDVAPSGSPQSVELPRVEGLVASGEKMRRVMSRVAAIADTNIAVYLTGETGAGKEVVARAIHTLSSRSNRAFEVVDCGSLPDTLIASELFGHQKGAFTGAADDRSGAFSRAHQGTIFLDEIGDLSLQLQPLLLGVLERGSFRPLGSDKEIQVDVRLLVATHVDLRRAVNEGRFREDLYYRIAGERIEIPPLRERLDELPALVDHFAEDYLGEPAHDALPYDVLTSLQRRRWPGNLRELRNVVRVSLALGEVPTEEEEVQSYREAKAEVVADFERSFLTDLIRRHDGNASAASREVQMDRNYLLELLRKHDLR